MSYIDNLLNSVTMYKLVSISLTVLAIISVIFSFFGIISYSPLSLITSALVLAAVCFVTNYIIAMVLKVPTNNESYIITALILFFLCTPITDTKHIFPTVLVGALAMASKYVFAIHKKHIFNPAAIGSFLMGLLGFGNIIWWVGSGPLLPFTLIISFLIVKKLRRFRLFFTFLLTAMLSITSVSLVFNHTTFMDILSEMFISWPLIFFGGVMFTEPLTTPPTHRTQTIYGILVGVLFGSQFHIGPLYSTPEFALIIGNMYSYIVSPKYRLTLRLQQKKQLASNMHEFIFSSDQKIKFQAGQYLEWTIADPWPDLRGNRRFFTIASAPTEDDIHLGVRFEQNGSSFKKKLASLKEGDAIVASQLSGEFILPSDTKQKLVFIAGGIGITPYRSMVQYLIDTKKEHDIVLIYSVPTADEIAYKEFFDTAVTQIGLKVVYLLTKEDQAPQNWTGHVGRLNDESLKELVKDYTERTYYLSGPNSMVTGYKKLLLSNGIKRASIKTDYFPGF